MAIANKYPSIRPSLNLDFANSKTIDPRITFSRASSATYFDEKGGMRTAPDGVPRIDFDPATGECNGLLIEEQRTNLLKYSEKFDNAAWAKNGGSSIVANSSAAPDGASTADTLIGANSIGWDMAFRSTEITASINTAYTASIWVKSAGATTVTLWLMDNAAPGTIGSATTVTTAWTRLSVSMTTSATTNAINFMIGATDGNLYIWGAQLEAGSFPTSYIKTEASQVTRAADTAVMTGTNFSDWYRQDYGTFVVESKIRNPISSAVFTADSSSSAEELRIASISNGKNPGFYASAGGTTSITSSVALNVNTPFTAGGAYAVNDSVLAVNGTLGVVDTDCILPSVNQLRLGQRPGGSYLNGHISRLAYYPKRLTNEQLQALTA